MQTERLIRVLKRFQQPEGEMEKTPIAEFAPYAAGIQKAIDTIIKLRKNELNNIVQQYEEADEKGKRQISRIGAALAVCMEPF